MSILIRRLLLASSAIVSAMFGPTMAQVIEQSGAASQPPDYMGQSGGIHMRHSGSGGSRAHRKWRKLRSSGRR